MHVFRVQSCINASLNFIMFVFDEMTNDVVDVFHHQMAAIAKENEHVNDGIWWV